MYQYVESSIPRDNGCTPRHLTVDPYNMTRNLKIILIMLALTVLIHMAIYHQESRARGDYVFGRGAVPWTSNETSTRPAPRGDGQLYTLMEESRAAFLPAYPKQLIILGYQRVGSSFFGQMFDGHPGFYYTYEPLDSVYADMYGTAQGYNVPTDIMNDARGNPREIPEEEKLAVWQLLSNILSCNTEALPTGFLIHRYWYLLSEHFLQSWLPYRDCLQDRGLLHTRKQCWTDHLQDMCSHRFGQYPEKLKICHNRLQATTAGDATPFGRYHQCMAAARGRVQPCITIMDRKCKEARVWVTKTVRGTMAEMSELLEQNPNLRIIHLIRDPRPVVVSRAKDPSYRGIYTGDIHKVKGGQKSHEAQMYCNTVVRDLRHRRVLESAYPGRVVQVVYEDFLQKPAAYAEAVYKFLDEEIPAELGPWLENHTITAGKDNNSSIHAWKSKLTYVEGERISHHCAEFYHLLNYKWPYND